MKSHVIHLIIILMFIKHSKGYDIYNTSIGVPFIQDFVIHVTDITNTTVDFQWKQPRIMNGFLHHYDVEYHILYDKEWKMGPIDYNCINLKSIYCRMEQLDSYREYEIVIIMYTTTMYKYRSKSEFFRTFPGSPDKVTQPLLSHGNITTVIVSWQPSMKPAGHLNYYEISSIAANPNEINNLDSKGRNSFLCKTQISEIDNSVYHSDSCTFHLPIPNCKDGEEQQAFFIIVRAVNKNEMPQDYPDSIPHYGPWSVAGLVLKKCVLLGITTDHSYNCILSCGAMYDTPVVPNVHCTFMTYMSFNNVSSINEYMNKYA